MVDITARQKLTEIYEELYGPLDLNGPDFWSNIEQLAEDISTETYQAPPWGKRYLYSVLKYDDYSVSPKLVKALEMFAAVRFDGLNPMMAHLTKVLCYSRNGNVKPGSIIFGNTVRCICGVLFVPRSWNGKYCCDDCRREARRLKRKNVSR